MVMAGFMMPLLEMYQCISSSMGFVDTGRLLVALNNLRAFSTTANWNWTQRINNVVLNSTYTTCYASLLPDVRKDAIYSTSVYSYYVDSGFASFWSNDTSVANVPNLVLNNILNAGNITTTPGNVTLPKATISCEPLLCSLFELNK